MKYIFKVTGEKIQTFPNPVLYTGNSSSYSFEFMFDECWNDLIKIGVFTKGEEVYHVQIEASKLIVPNEMLTECGEFTFGIFGTNGEDGIKRISSNILTFSVAKGTYDNMNQPSSPTPDLWEKLFSNSIPKIIDGKWYLYNPSEGVYTDTGLTAVTYTPQKGVDYFTPDDIESLGLDKKENISNKSDSIGETPDTEKYPTEKAVADYVSGAITKAINDSWEVAV